MNFGLHCLAVAVFASAAAFASDPDERPKGYRFRGNPHKTISSRSGQDGSKRPLLKSGGSSFPSKWDSRDQDGQKWITPVRDQGEHNTCWTFATYATLETQLLKSGSGTYDFAEKNMANLHGFDISLEAGGIYDMAAAYLLRWGGAVAETNDTYETSANAWSQSPMLNPAIHVQNIVWVPARTSSTDNDTLKAAITNYGAVATSIRWYKTYEQGESYYYPYGITPDHAVAVIGWDDDYEASKFKSNPKGNGAWLIKNSWGEDSGTNGYYFVSYYDSTFAKTEDGIVFIPATAEENYTAVYGYDKFGRVDDCADNNDLEAAVFTSAWNEEVAAIGVYSFLESQDYSVAVYTNVMKGADSPISGGTLAYSQDGSLTHAGYTTIRLAKPVKLADGTTFAVVYRQKGGKPQHAMDYSEEGYCTSNHHAGETFLGNSNTGNWNDMSPKCVCLKAYTRSTVSASDGPEEYDSGVKMLTALAATNATLYAETGETFGAFANLVGANGRTLWASWLAGFDPANKDSNKLVVDISVTNNVPYLSWTPNLGADRNYRIWGTETLAEENWQEVDDLKKTDAKFFKVTVEQ